jgi:hypothetical protein
MVRSNSIFSSFWSPTIARLAGAIVALDQSFTGLRRSNERSGLDPGERAP